MLWERLKARAVFEHFTHDASVIPMEFYPMWTRQYRRIGDKLDNSKYYKAMRESDNASVKARIARDGPLCTRAFDTKIVGEKKMWSRPPHKLALDYLWYKGELTTSHRENFIKFYDLTERVVPQSLRETQLNDKAQIDWLCRNALKRMGFGSLGDIQRFWDAVSATDVKAWAAENTQNLMTVNIESANGNWTSALAFTSIEDEISALPPVTSRLRIINPFDPAVRDRKRLERLYGFGYKNEMFMPKAKRQWGYYVYPLLEGDKFIGRIDLKADRKASTINVINVWAEPGIKWTQTRQKKLDAELSRLMRFIDIQNIIWEVNRLA